VALCADENKMTTPTTTRKIRAFFFTGLDRSRLTNLDRYLKKNATIILRLFLISYINVTNIYDLMLRLFILTSTMDQELYTELLVSSWLLLLHMYLFNYMQIDFCIMHFSA